MIRIIFVFLMQLTFCYGQILKPIYVSNQNDPRLLAYEDSLYSWKHGNSTKSINEQIMEELKELQKFNFNDDAYRKSNIQSYEKSEYEFKEKKLKGKGKEVNTRLICNKVLFQFYNPITGRHWVIVGGYEKPIQPIIYRPIRQPKPIIAISKPDSIIRVAKTYEIINGTLIGIKEYPLKFAAKK